MSNSKIKRVVELEGGCHANQKISTARRELEEWLADDLDLVNGVDIFVDDQGRYQGHDASSMEELKEKQGEHHVFYLFEVGLTERAESVLLAEGLI